MKTIYHSDSVLKVSAVLNGFTKMIPQETITEMSAAVGVLIEANAKRNDSDKDYNYFTSMVETYLRDYHKITPEAFIWFIRNVTDNEILIRYADVPYFRDIVFMYGQLLRAARCVNKEEVDSYIMGVLEA
ncbi:hypothetical protein pEaSNUABM44_00547 [Erwinia phage pEa_SNUABM_44]|nr:hypothetical protein pEaSNUABM44_00547 [Erwinia phage pEa_SNUABM_44]